MRVPAIVVHGGAGERAAEREAACAAGCEAAAQAGGHILEAGGSAVDAVVAAVMVLESDPAFNAGVGSCLNAEGRVEMDASVMDGTRLAGAGVALVTTVCHPVALARALLDDGRHVLLAGAGAEALAARQQLATAPPETFITAEQRARWSAGRLERAGTVGAVAIDRRGHLAAATSTGGLSGKLPGRIGDTALIGAGTYADDAAGAASATGHGESIILAGVARAAVDGVRSGRDPHLVAEAVVRQFGGRHSGGCGLILVDRYGRLGMASNTTSMPTAGRPR